jgi:hypothetical protein
MVFFVLLLDQLTLQPQDDQMETTRSGSSGYRDVHRVRSISVVLGNNMKVSIEFLTRFLSHWLGRFFDTTTPMILPQRMACPNGRLTLREGSLAGSILTYQSRRYYYEGCIAPTRDRH